MGERPQPKPPHRVRISDTLAEATVRLDDDVTIADVACEPDWADVETQFVELRGCLLDGGSLAGSLWRRAAWSDAQLRDVDLAVAQFQDSGWIRVAAERCRATGLNLAGCTLSDVDCRDTRLDLANLRYAKLTRCAFVGCRLTGAELIGAELADVRFTDCELDEATFAQARCSRVRFEQCRLTGLKGVSGLAGATIDPLDLIDIAHQLAGALDITLA